MPRPRIDENDKKEPLTIKLPKRMIEELRKIKGYNQIVRDLIENYLKNRNDSS
jgi:hypothetical protein